MNSVDLYKILLRANAIRLHASKSRTLTVAQLEILLFLKQRHAIKNFDFSTSSISRTINLPRTTTIRNIQILEQEGWVTITEVNTQTGGHPVHRPKLTRSGLMFVRQLLR